MFAAATDFHHMRLLGVLAVFAAVLAVLLRRTIAGWMRANVFLIICHNVPPFSVGLTALDPRTPSSFGQVVAGRTQGAGRTTIVRCALPSVSTNGRSICSGCSSPSMLMRRFVVDRLTAAGFSTKGATRGNKFVAIMRQVDGEQRMRIPGVSVSNA